MFRQQLSEGLYNLFLHIHTMTSYFPQAAAQFDLIFDCR